MTMGPIHIVPIHLTDYILSFSVYKMLLIKRTREQQSHQDKDKTSNKYFLSDQKDVSTSPLASIANMNRDWSKHVKNIRIPSEIPYVNQNSYHVSISPVSIYCMKENNKRSSGTGLKLSFLIFLSRELLARFWHPAEYIWQAPANTG